MAFKDNGDGGTVDNGSGVDNLFSDNWILVSFDTPKAVAAFKWTTVPNGWTDSDLLVYNGNSVAAQL